MKLDKQSIKLQVLFMPDSALELHDEFELSELLLEGAATFEFVERDGDGISSERSKNGSCLCDLKPHSRQLTSFCKIPPKMFPIIEARSLLGTFFMRVKLMLLLPFSSGPEQFSRHSLSNLSNTYRRNS